MIFSESNYQVITLNGDVVISSRLIDPSKDPRWSLVWHALKLVLADGWSLYNIIVQYLFVSCHNFIFYVRVLHVTSSQSSKNIFRITLVLFWHTACMKWHIFSLFNLSLLYQSPLGSTLIGNYFGSSLRHDWPRKKSSLRRFHAKKYQFSLKARLFTVLFMCWDKML